jgi:hypothetical protein
MLAFTVLVLRQQPWVVCLVCFGGYSGGGTPGYIPNPEAKPVSADGTAGGTLWESRTPPNKFYGPGSWGNPQEPGFFALSVRALSVRAVMLLAQCRAGSVDVDAEPQREPSSPAGGLVQPSPAVRRASAAFRRECRPAHVPWSYPRAPGMQRPSELRGTPGGPAEWPNRWLHGEVLCGAARTGLSSGPYPPAGLVIHLGGPVSGPASARIRTSGRCPRQGRSRARPPIDRAARPHGRAPGRGPRGGSAGPCTGARWLRR